MTKSIFTGLFVLFATANSFAHYLWIETNPEGQIGQEQIIKVYFGEYTYGVTEEVAGDAFKSVNNFTLWVTDDSGKKTELKTVSNADHYEAVFTPKSVGTYTVLLNNDKIDVIDYTKYNFGIFKTHYHAVARFNVGNEAFSTTADNLSGITIKDISEEPDEVKLQVLYKNDVQPESEVKVFAADQWSKTLETNEIGVVSFSLPWETKYIVEVTTKEEVPGTYKDEPYEFVWHCATYFLTK